MREIVSFTKEIDFKTMVHKITGISLEHTLKLANNSTIEGEFLISGTYKMTGASQIEEDFYYKIPVDISIDDKYNTNSLEIDIYDFTYEILNEEILKLSIDLSLDNLELKEIEPLQPELEDIKTDEEIINEVSEDIEIINIEEPPQTKQSGFRDTQEELFKEIDTKQDLTIPTQKEGEEKLTKPDDAIVDSIFMAFQTTPETYSTYRVYIVRENDTIEEIINKYKITKEQLEEYNNLSSISTGTKLIIPNTNE